MAFSSARTPAKPGTGRTTAASAASPVTPVSHTKRHSVTSSTFMGTSQRAPPSPSSLSSVTTPMHTHRDPNSATTPSGGALDASTVATARSMAQSTRGGGGGGGGENVRVFVRLRDFNNSEKEKFIPSDLAVRMSGSTVEVNVPGRNKFPFTFDEVFWSNSMEEEGKPYADQADLYNVIGAPLVSNVLAGFNSSIIAYGQTGSGKTYSIFGPTIDEDGTKKGLIPRVCDGIFAALAAEASSTLNKNTKFTVSVTMLEVYLEEVFDLLNRRTKLTVRQDTATSFGVVGAKSFDVKSYDEVLKLIEKGDSQKTFAATAMNERSSRAHTLFQLVVSAVSPAGSRSAKVMLADLAGCERIKVSKTDHGTALDEACNINLSLLTLGTCIEAAVARSKQGRGIDGMGEFRQSTLTKLLKDFIGGNSRTAMLIAIAPALKDVNLTLQALRFADRAKQIQTHAKINYVQSKAAGGACGGRIAEDLKTLYDSKKELLDKEYQLERMQAELAQRQDDVALAQIRLDEERRAIAERVKLNETSEEEKKMLQARVLEIEATMKGLSTELADMEREKDAMREQILAVVQDNAAIVSDKEALERQVMDLQNQLLTLETERDDEMELLQDQKLGLEKDIEVMDERMRAREAYHARVAKEEKAAADAALAALRTELEAAMAKAVDEERAKYATLEASHAASRKQCFSLTASLEAEKKAHEQSKADAAAEKAAAEAANARAVEVLQAHFAKEIEGLGAQIAALEAALAAEKTERGAAEASLVAKSADFDALTSSSTAKIETLEETLATATAAHAAASAKQSAALSATEAERIATCAALNKTASSCAAGGFWDSAADALFAAVRAKEDDLLSNVSALFASDAAEKQQHLAAVEAAAAAAANTAAASIAALEADVAAKAARITEHEASIAALTATVAELTQSVADWTAKEAAAREAHANAVRSAAEAAEIAETEHQLASDSLREAHAEAVAALEATIAEAKKAYAALETVLEEEKVAAEMKAMEAAEAHSAAIAARDEASAAAAAAAAAVVAQREATIAAEVAAKEDFAARLEAEEARGKEQRSTIARLEKKQRELEAAAVTAKADSDAAAADAAAAHERVVAELQQQQRRDLTSLKATATSVAQQQHHHAKMLAAEAHQAQFIIQQALAKYNAAVAAGGGAESIETVFAGIGSRTSSSASLLSPSATNRSRSGAASGAAAAESAE